MYYVGVENTQFIGTVTRLTLGVIAIWQYLSLLHAKLLPFSVEFWVHRHMRVQPKLTYML